MPKTQAAAVMKAADQARSAQRRVDDCKRALVKAERARDRADAHYLELVSASLANRQQREPAQIGEEVSHAQAN